jgi:hypothetical protein
MAWTPSGSDELTARPTYSPGMVVAMVFEPVALKVTAAEAPASAGSFYSIIRAERCRFHRRGWTKRV